jgi:HEAT repeat protein
LKHIDERTAGRFLGVDPQRLGPSQRPQLLALQASGGDPLVLNELRRSLLLGGVAERSSALLTLPAIGREAWAAEVLTSDTLPEERSRAAATLGVIADEPAARDALRLALNDGDDDVRLAALSALLSVGDVRAVDRALAMLGGTLAEIEQASLALRDAWDPNPGLADRARARLLEQIELDRADFDRIKPRLQALGLVQGRESAEALMALAPELAGRSVQGLAAHRWLARSAGNAGPEARAYLAELWRDETDHLHRMDLLEAAGGAQDENARRFLIEVVEGERATEIERLVAAELLLQLGPAREVAPILKRVALRMQGEQTRRAFDCLLWTWYG